MASTTKTPLLLVDWGRLAHEFALTEIDRGRLPNLRRLISTGMSMPLAGIRTDAAAVRLTTLLTGKLPHAHGIHGNEELNPARAIRPVTVASRGASTLWEILAAQNVRCTVIHAPAAGSVASDTNVRVIDVPAADDRSVHAAAVRAIEHAAWDFAAVCYTGDEPVESLDAMLGELIDKAGPGVRVVLVTDGDGTRGLLVAAGPGFARDGTGLDATVLDVAPTVLAAFAQPCGLDMHGRPLMDLFVDPPEPTFVPSWDTTAARPPACDLNSETAWERATPLVGLQYIDPLARRDAASRACHLANLRTLARSWVAAGRADVALPILASVVDDLVLSVRAFLSVGDVASARRRVDRGGDDTVAVAIAHADIDVTCRRAAAALDTLAALGPVDPIRASAAAEITGRAWLKLARPVEADAAFARAFFIDAGNVNVADGRAVAAMMQGDAARAVDHALRAVTVQPRFAVGHYHLGVALARLGATTGAVTAFQQAVEWRPGFRPAIRQLARLSKGAD